MKSLVALSAALTSALMLLAAPALANSIVLAAPVDIATDTRPGGLVVADFNNDDRDDLLVVNLTTVTVLINNGNGTFRPGVNYAASANGSQGVAVDLNGDDNIDVVLANFAGSNLVVLIGRGDGTFDAPRSVPAGRNPLGIAAGLIPSEGAVGTAIVVANNGDNNVSVIALDGDDNFLPPVNHAVGRDPRGLVVGDFNGDGQPDIAVTNFGDNNISLIASGDDGKLKPAVNYPVGAGPQGIAFATLDADQFRDLVVVNNTAGTVSVLINKGDGTLNAAVTYAVGSLPRYAVIVDIDGDGRLDIAVSSNSGNSVAVLKGKGDGTFNPAITFATGTTPNDIRAINLDPDDKPEIITANFGAGSISILRNASVEPNGTVMEFYNTNLDQYFMTANTEEQQAVSGGAAGPGWSATGNTFNAGGPQKVCRFYGSQSPGPNSHFYTIDVQECQALKTLQATTPATQKRWNYESDDFLSSPSANQQCAGDLIPVYRAYNNGQARGIDSNHRITTNKASYDAQIAKGWAGEGVVMCAPVSSS